MKTKPLIFSLYVQNEFLIISLKKKKLKKKTIQIIIKCLYNRIRDEPDA